METPSSPRPLLLNSTSNNTIHFNTLFSHMNSILIISPKTRKTAINVVPSSHFLSTSMSIQHKLPTTKPPKTTTTTLKNNHHLSALERAVIGAIAGGAAGAFTYFCLHPLDTIKTKLQTKGGSQIYKNTLDAITKTFQSKGLSGFYSGVSAVIVGSTFSSALMFGTCEFGKSLISKFETYPSLLIPPTASLMGNIVSSLIMVPKELITQRMQANYYGITTSSSWKILVQILQKDGVLGLYMGYSATLMRNLPNGMLSYSSFEWLKTVVLKNNGKTEKMMTPLESVLCGAMAGAISASLTTPLDVVKTRLMTQQVNGGGGGVREVVKKILMEEGWVGLSRGMGARVLHSACFSAIGYFAFETARLAILDHYLRHKHKHKHHSNNNKK